MRTIILAFLLLLGGISLVPAQVAIIAHRSVPESTLRQSQFLDICLLNMRSWSNGQAIQLFFLRDNPAEEEDVYTLLRRTPLEMRKVWLRAQLSGQARPPVFISSQEELMKQVESTPGAIGFVSRDKVQGNVKVLLIVD